MIRTKEESIARFLAELEKSPKSKVHGRSQFNAHLVDPLVKAGKCVMVDKVLFVRV